MLKFIINFLIKLLITLGVVFFMWAILELPLTDQYFKSALIGAIALGLGLIAYIINDRRN